MHGDMVKAVQETWEKIWKMDLKRTWTGDFEEYVDSDMTGNATERERKATQDGKLHDKEKKKKRR